MNTDTNGDVPKSRKSESIEDGQPQHFNSLYYYYYFYYLFINYYWYCGGCVCFGPLWCFLCVLYL